MGKKYAANLNTRIAEGAHIFKITEAEYNAIKESVHFTFTLQNGQKHFENLYLLKNSGEVNQFAVNHAARIVANAMQDSMIEELDTDVLPDCIGKFILAEVQYQEYNGKTYERFNPFGYDYADAYELTSAKKDDLDNLF